MPDTISSADAIHSSTTGSTTTESGPSTDPTGASNAASGAAAPSNRTPTAEPAPPSVSHAAVQHCCEAWQTCYTAERARGKSECDAGSTANTAYRNAMPYLTTHQNIRDFIACVTHGILLNVIFHRDVTKLLYAAQVALSACAREPKPPRTRT